MREILPATCLNKAFKFKFKSANVKITWVVSDDEASRLLSHSPLVHSVRSPQSIEGEFDLLVNLSPSVHPSDPAFVATEKIGFNFSSNTDKTYDILHGSAQTDKSPFQIYCNLAGLAWKGEGYGIHYYPQSKSKKNRCGISVAHAKLRRYVEDHLNLEGLKVCVLPYKRNAMKQMDEINRCFHIITDDLETMHLSVYLRKFVHYLETLPTNTRPEFFGQGRIYQVPKSIVK